MPKYNKDELYPSEFNDEDKLQFDADFCSGFKLPSKNPPASNIRLGLYHDSWSLPWLAEPGGQLDASGPAARERAAAVRLS